MEHARTPRSCGAGTTPSTRRTSRCSPSSWTRTPWHTPGRSPIAGDYQGRDAVFAQFGRYGGDTDGTFKAELMQVFTGDDGRVMGLHHNSGKRNGKQLDTDCCIVFEIANGRMTSGREHFFDLSNWDEFWS